MNRFYYVEELFSTEIIESFIPLFIKKTIRRSTPFFILIKNEILNNFSIEEKILKHNKNYLWINIVNTINNEGKTGAFSVRACTKQGFPFFPMILFSIVLEMQEQEKNNKRNKGYPNWKGRIKSVSFCKWHGLTHWNLTQITKIFCS